MSDYTKNCLKTIGSLGYYSPINLSILLEVSDQHHSAYHIWFSRLMLCAPKQLFPSLLLSILMNINRLIEIKPSTHLVSVMERQEYVLTRLYYMWKHSSVGPVAVCSPFTPFISTLTTHVSQPYIVIFRTPEATETIAMWIAPRTYTVHREFWVAVVWRRLNNNK